MDFIQIRTVLVATLVASFVAVSGCSFSNKSSEPPQTTVLSGKQPKVTPADTVKKSAAPEKTKSEEDDVQVIDVPPVITQKVEKQDLTTQPVEKSGDSAAAPEAESVPEYKIPTDPNTFLVIAEPKRVEHPNYGKGDKRGFTVNGVPGKDVVVERGKTYTFQVRTGIQHDFYLSGSPVGWGASAFQDGVAGQFTYKGDVTFKQGPNTPDLLYYQCRNHQSMGGQIVVVAKGTDVSKVEQKLLKEREQNVAQHKGIAAGSEVTEGKAKQKVSYADMILKIKGKSLSKSQLATATEKLASANEAMTKGSFDAAAGFADDVVAMLSGSASKGPTEEEIASQKAEYDEMLASINSLQESHQHAFENAKKHKEVNPVDYDHKQVQSVIAESQSLARDKDFETAKKELSKAEAIIAKAMSEMLSAKTLVYELKFDTPKDEYEYEVKRFESYKELIPVALEVKKPAEGAIKLMDMFAKKADFFAEKAADSAKANNFPEALAIIKDATVEIKRALMTLGVSM